MNGLITLRSIKENFSREYHMVLQWENKPPKLKRSVTIDTLKRKATVESPLTWVFAGLFNKTNMYKKVILRRSGFQFLN